MIAIALFIVSGILLLLTSWRREHAVSPEGTPRPDRTTAVLMLQAVCVAIAAIVVATVDMITFVS
jgi:hypothetical protein